MTENKTAGAPVERAAIERWEDEGGRALVLEQSLRGRPGDPPRSDHEESAEVRS